MFGAARERCLLEKGLLRIIDLADWIEEYEGDIFREGRVRDAFDGLFDISALLRRELKGMVLLIIPSASRSCMRSLRTLLIGPLISGSIVRLFTGCFCTSSVTDTSSG